MPGKDLFLLSLDDGGVRALSSLAILRRLIETINGCAAEAMRVFQHDWRNEYRWIDRYHAGSS